MQRIGLALSVFLILAACSQAVEPTSKSSLYIYRYKPPALVEISSSNQPVREIPVTVPDGCGLSDVFGPRHGLRLALELNCPFGQAVLVLDTARGRLQQPVTHSDSHFLAWSEDGQSLYLRVNSINRPQIIRIGVDGGRAELPISELTYDLAPESGGSSGFLFALSRGMGLGSELWITRSDGGSPKQLAADPSHYLSLARWSPDGNQIAFIKIPDTATPYTEGELWLMRADGSGAQRLAQADAGHGFAPAWSPDGSQIAFVYRENPTDPSADQSADALLSNIHAISLSDGKERALTTFVAARVGSPAWQPDGNRLAFTTVVNDKMQVDVLDVDSGALRNVMIEPACCAAWVLR